MGAQNSKEAYDTGLANAAAAFDDYAKSRRGERKGTRMGRPRFKSKRKARPACEFTTGTIRLDDRRHIVPPRLGRIRLHEDVQPLVDAIAEGGTRILSVTLRFERGRWFAVLQTEERPTIAPATRPYSAVGIDLGVKTLLVMADSAGEVREVANPKHYDQTLTQLRKASRTVSRRRGPTGAPDRPRPVAGRKPTRSVTGCTTGWPTCGRTISTKPPRVSPPSTAPSWSRTST
ncbi:transposase [Streptomyces sp. GbtcB7]|uniref:transposase n=1 Tax=Streptomyces sp. GbtcB7 TaxID=2824752 RepID=UPI001C2F8C13|nr:transposase [Streptomyces sp. GbtcB7]